MKYKLILITGILMPTLSTSQTYAPPGVSAQRFNYCMNERIYSKSMFADNGYAFCERWAGPVDSDSGNYIYSIPAEDLVSQFQDRHPIIREQPLKIIPE
jgi:hypothetical protein